MSASLVQRRLWLLGRTLYSLTSIARRDLPHPASLRNSSFDRSEAIAEVVAVLDPAAGRVRGGGGKLSWDRLPGGVWGAPERLQPDHLLERRRKRPRPVRPERVVVETASAAGEG